MTCPWCGGEPDDRVGGREVGPGYVVANLRCRECQSWWHVDVSDDGRT